MAAILDFFVEAQKHHQAERFGEAERLYHRAVETDPKHVAAWYHLGLACIAQDKLGDAGNAFERTLAISHKHVDALTQLGIVLARQNRLAEAVEKFRRAVEVRPEHAKAHNNMGVALMQMGQRDEGMACYREAARLEPHYAEAQFNLGVALGDRKQNEEAIGCYEAALHARPDYFDALMNLGLLLVSERRAAGAVTVLKQAVRLKPDNAEAHNNLGLALADLGRFEEAVASCDGALRLRPLDAKSHMNRGNALSSLGRIDEAVASYEMALRLQPDYPTARWNRSLAWLAQGDFEKGWAEYEWRWKRAETKTRHFPEPLWDGEALHGKTILLWCEQGFGDTIQFVRYAAVLKRRGATVCLECPERMMALLATCPGIDRVCAEGTPILDGFDCQAPLMSLPYLCGTTLSNVPAETPYLFADPVRVEQWRAELGPGAQLKIGIAWQGNPKHTWDRHRSFGVQWFRSLANVPGVKLFSLQKGGGADQLTAANFPIIDLGSRLDEEGSAFQDTAAVMRNLDLVITCDSALAHLAGALGVPVWVPMSIPTDWRWLQDRDDTPWYPTMRLFRQTQLGQWRAVFERMRAELPPLPSGGEGPGVRGRRVQETPTSSGRECPGLRDVGFQEKHLVAIDRAHNAFLVGAVLSRKPERVLELGVGSAYVTNSLLSALRYNGRGELTSVDNWFDWQGKEPPFVVSLRAQGANIVVSGEEEFVRAAAEDAYDLLVSDADHFHSATWLDQHLRIVKNDGFLFFHDTNQPQMFPGLATIETQIRERGLPHYHFKESSRADERCERGWLFVINKKKS